MKKRLFVMAVFLVCILNSVAGASPSVTDGETTGWITENNYLYLQDRNGKAAELFMKINDLLQATENELICLSENQQVIAVKKDGSGSRIVEDSEYSLLKDQELRLENGVLYLKDQQISASVCAAATDSTYLYYVEKDDLSYVIHVYKLKSTSGTILPQSRDAYAVALSGKYVPEPLNLTVTREALTLTGTDHQVTVMNLLNGETTRYPATSEQTAAACMQGGMLYRYLLKEEQHWALESGTAVATPTPAPTPTPTQKPATQQNSDDDDTIHYGAYGKKVRKIQERLAELGYPIQKIDGKYGQETQLAIDLFCNAIHVREHKYITCRVQNKLFAKNAPPYDPYLPLKLGDQGVCVLYMQTRLKELGYDPGKVDGIYGKNTMAAVALFQQDHGIKPAEKEKPGETASHELLELLYAPVPDPTPTTEPTAEPASDVTSTLEPTESPANTATPAPTNTPETTNTPEPTNTPVPATQTDL